LARTNANTLAPSIVAAGIKVFDMLSATTVLRDKLEKNTLYFREKIRAAELLERGIYVIGFFYPVVPKGKARIRVQISAAMEIYQLDEAVDAFTEVGQKLKVLS